MNLIRAKENYKVSNISFIKDKYYQFYIEKRKLDRHQKNKLYSHNTNGLHGKLNNLKKSPNEIDIYFIQYEGSESFHPMTESTFSKNFDTIEYNRNKIINYITNKDIL